MPTDFSGVTYYAYDAIPLEADQSDARQFNTEVQIRAVGGGEIVLRSPSTGDVISSTVTSSAVNGLLPSFLAPALKVSVNGGVVDQILSSSDVPDLAQDAATARAAAQAARDEAQTLRAQVDTLLAQQTSGPVTSVDGLGGAVSLSNSYASRTEFTTLNNAAVKSAVVAGQSITPVAGVLTLPSTGGGVGGRGFWSEAEGAWLAYNATTGLWAENFRPATEDGEPFHWDDPLGEADPEVPPAAQSQDIVWRPPTTP